MGEYIRNDVKAEPSHVCDLPELKKGDPHGISQRGSEISRRIGKYPNFWSRKFSGKWIPTSAPRGSVYSCDECSTFWKAYPTSTKAFNAWETISRRQFDRIKKRRLKTDGS